MRIIALTLYLLAVSWNCYAAPFGDIEAEGDISANGNLVVDGTATTGATEATSAGGQIANYNNTSGSTDITMRYGYPGYGWYWLYEGSGSGNDNKHKLFSEGAGGTDVQVYEVTQDGVTIFSKSLSALNLSGTNTGDNTVCTSGAATTATTASTGDTATDFFDAGTIADARLETTIDRTIFNASDSVNVGGGYGSTGFTVQSTGNVYTDGDVTVGSSAGDPAGITIITPDGGVALGNWNGALVSIRGGTLRTDFGYNNGEGCEGATLDGGSLSIDSGLIVDGTSTLTGELQVAGGYGSTGVTIESDGDVSMDGDVTVGSSAGDPASITIITPDGEEGGTAFKVQGSWVEEGATLANMATIELDGEKVGLYLDYHYETGGGSADYTSQGMTIDTNSYADQAYLGKDGLLIKDSAVILVEIDDDSVLLKNDTEILGDLEIGGGFNSGGISMNSNGIRVKGLDSRFGDVDNGTGVAFGEWNGAMVDIRGGSLRTDFGYNNGEGCEGATLDGGSFSIDSDLIVDGTSTLTGEVQVGGGYGDGDGGVTIGVDGDITTDGTIHITEAKAEWYDSGISIANSGYSASLVIRSWSDFTSDSPRIMLDKVAAEGTEWVKTVTDDILGEIHFRGTSTEPSPGARIYAQQIGETVGEQYVPANLYLETYSAEDVNVNQLVLASDGNVGINIADPDAQLHVDGNVVGEGTFQFNGNGILAGEYGDTGVTIDADGSISTNGDLIVDGTSTLTGNVGIGANAPLTHEFEIQSPSTMMKIRSYHTGDTGTSWLVFSKSAASTVGTETTTAAGDLLGGIDFKGVNAAGDYRGGASILVEQQTGTGLTNLPANMTIETRSDVGGNISQLVLEHDGDVGIGEAAPDSKLEVKGTFHVTEIATLDKGIKFPATAVASTDPNTLDDYEEGTWTPTIVCSTSGSYTLDTNNNTLGYTKIGDLVHIQGGIGITGESSPSGQLRVSLPFTPVALAENADQILLNASIIGGGETLGSTVYGYITAGLYYRMIAITDAGTEQVIDEDNVDDVFTLRVAGTYRGN